jgi:hypothetical protein
MTNTVRYIEHIRAGLTIVARVGTRAGCCAAVLVLGVAAAACSQGPTPATRSGAQADTVGGYVPQSLLALGGGWNKCLDDSDDSTQWGNKIQLYDCNGTDAQAWTYSVTTGTFQGPGGMCLDVTGGNSASGTPVQLWGCNGTEAQRWTWNQNGTITGIGGKCLDVTDAGMANGTQIQIWDCNGTDAQGWQGSACAPPVEGETCSLGGNPCQAGYTRCFGYNVTCEGPASSLPDGASCGGGSSCQGGHCVCPWPSDVASVCSPTSDPCVVNCCPPLCAGLGSECFTGNAQDETSCESGGSCVSGRCEGGACLATGEPCQHDSSCCSGSCNTQSPTSPTCN